MRRLIILALFTLMTACTGGRRNGETGQNNSLPDTTARRILAEKLASGVPWGQPIFAGMASLMEVRTGRVLASVTLYPDPSVISDSLELFATPCLMPASLAQAATLMHFLKEDPGVLDRHLPTRHGRLEPSPFPDELILDFERTTQRDEITVREGFLMSSAFTIAQLATTPTRLRKQDPCESLLKDWQRYWRLEVDNEVTTISFCGKQNLYYLSCGKAGYLSQQQILRFYNAIAAEGKMMVDDSSEKICSKAVADTLRSLLRQNVIQGTNRPMASSTVPIAGKTGTGILKTGARIPGLAVYESIGEYWHSTFAGFFPAEQPSYTLAVTVIYRNDAPAYAIPNRIAVDLAEKISKFSFLSQ